MATNILGNIIIWGIIVAFIIAILAYILHWFYVRTSKNMAFVRTGLGGEKVVLNAGGFVIPILHHVTYVNMNIMPVSVRLMNKQSAITRDRVRIDIEAEFQVKVSPTPQSVAQTASSFGNKTMQENGIADLLLGRFTSVLRAVASQISLDEAHEDRDGFMAKVTDKVNAILQQNGLHLESVAILHLDQTDMEHFSPTNKFDAQGLSTLVKTIEEKRKTRNDTEQSALVAIRQRNLQAEQEMLQIDQQSETAKLEQERMIALMRAQQQADIKRQQVTEEAQAEKIRINTEQQIKAEEIIAEQQVQQADIDRNIAILEKKQQQTSAKVAYEKAKLDVVAAEQKTAQTREVLIAEYKTQVAKIISQKEADVAQITAAAEKILGTVQAENQRQLNEADNILNNDARMARLKDKLIDHIEGIIRESAKPLENIDGIKILHMNGMGGNDSPRSPTDEVIDSALRYRAQAPMIDELMKELGIHNSDVGKMDVFRTAKDAKSLLDSKPNNKTNDTIPTETDNKE